MRMVWQIAAIALALVIVGLSLFGYAMPEMQSLLAAGIAFCN
jgi:hypothetical protein